MQNKATRDAYGEALVIIGREDKNVVVLDADLSKSTKTEMFAKKYPNRFFDMGIAESNMVGVAGGLAVSGKVVFASSFAIFLAGRAFEIIRNTVAYNNLNVKLVATHGGISVGADGGSHQAIEDVGIMRQLPNIRVIVPADYYETQKVIMTIYKENGPFYVRLTRPPSPMIYSSTYNFEIGKADWIIKGKEATIIACGYMVPIALEVSKELLSLYDIKVGVINMSSIKPIDDMIIKKAINETSMIFTLEDHLNINALGSAVAEVSAEYGRGRVIRIGIDNCFGKSGEIDDLFLHFELDKNSIIKKIRSLLRK